MSSNTGHRCQSEPAAGLHVSIRRRPDPNGTRTFPDPDGAGERQQPRSTDFAPDFAPLQPQATIGNLSRRADVSYELDVFAACAKSRPRACQRAASAGSRGRSISACARAAVTTSRWRGLISEQQLLGSHVPSTRGRCSSRRTCITRGAAISDVQQAQAQLESAAPRRGDRLRRAQTACHRRADRPPDRRFVSPRARGAVICRSGGCPACPSGCWSAPESQRRSARCGGQCRIRVARAAYFPVLSLLGTAGVESTAPPTGSAPEPLLSVARSVDELFDGGLHAAQSAAAHAASTTVQLPRHGAHGLSDVETISPRCASCSARAKSGGRRHRHAGALDQQPALQGRAVTPRGVSTENAHSRHLRRSTSASAAPTPRAPVKAWRRLGNALTPDRRFGSRVGVEPPTRCGRRPRSAPVKCSADGAGRAGISLGTRVSLRLFLACGPRLDVASGLSW